MISLLIDIIVFIIACGLIVLANTYKMILVNYYNKNKYSFKNKFTDEENDFFNRVVKTKNDLQTEEDMLVYRTTKAFEYILYTLSVVLFIIVFFL